MKLTDNHIELSRLKRDLGIRVDNNPVSEYLTDSIIKKYIKSYLQQNFFNVEKNEIDDVAISRYFKVTLYKAEDYSHGTFEIKKSKAAMEIYKEHGELGLIWFLINRLKFKKLYPQKL